MRIADRGEHAADVRTDRHQRADEHRMLLHMSHGEHGQREWDERDQCHVVGDQHTGEIGERNQRDHQTACGADMMQQTRADDTEHTDALETAHHQHQADELRDGAGMNIAGILLIRRNDEARDHGEYGSHYENGLVLQDLDHQTSHPFLQESSPATSSATVSYVHQMPYPLYPKLRLS